MSRSSAKRPLPRRIAGGARVPPTQPCPRAAVSLLLGLALSILLAACGSSTTKSVTSPTTTQSTTSVPYSTTAPATCNPPPNEGALGVCIPKPPKGSVKALPPQATSSALIPDTSEWTSSCAVYSNVIFRVYEAGTDRKDSKAACFAANARSHHVWYATYGFQRPGNCTYQADRTVQITREIGGAQLIIADDEVPLPASQIACFLARVRHDGYPAREYTCPGCADAQIGPVWIAAYPYRPPGTWIAHQFSSEWSCRGIYGDCSVDEGITHIGRVAPINRRALIARRRVLRFVLVKYGCRRREHRHQTLGPRCKRWKAEGDRINAQLGA